MFQFHVMIYFKYYEYAQHKYLRWNLKFKIISYYETPPLTTTTTK